MALIKRISLACFSDKGTVRSNNEDNMYASIYNIMNEKSEDYYSVDYEEAYSEDITIVAVFDGMGGTEGGEIASLTSAKQMNLFCDRVRERDSWSEDELSHLFLDIKKRMEHAIRMEMDNLDAEQPGSTCCGFIMRNGKLKPFWIGDSRLYLLRKNQLILLTKDHTIAQEKIDYGLITSEEALTVSSWHYITKYIGDNQNNFTLGEEFLVEPGDKYLLCTDGISDKFSPDKLAEYLLESPQRFVEIIAAEVKKQSKDNATAVVIELISEDERKDFTSYIKDKAKDYFQAVGEKAKENPFRLVD